MCGRHLALFSCQILSGPRALSHHIKTHPKRILAEVSGMVKYLADVRELRKKKAEQLGTVRLETWVG